MMRPAANTGFLTDRIYREIKPFFVMYKLRPGERVYIERIARQFGVSATPVREALLRLEAEGFVIRAPNKGFNAISLTHENILDHYQTTRLRISGELKLLPPDALSRLSGCAPIASVLQDIDRCPPGDGLQIALLCGRMFAKMAALNGSGRAMRSLAGANDHLQYIRTIECRYFDDVRTELQLCCELLLAGRRDELIVKIDTYHDRRVAALPDLIKLGQP